MLPGNSTSMKMNSTYSIDMAEDPQEDTMRLKLKYDKVHFEEKRFDFF